MPIIKSAIKRAKQTIVRRSRNLQVKRAIKQDVTALYEAVAAGNAKEVQAKLGEAYSEIDRAVKKGTLHKNTAARRKGQLATAIAKAAAAPAADAKPAKKAATAKTAAAKKPAAKKAAAAKKPAAK